jgi:hypothetical protein
MYLIDVHAGDEERWRSFLAVADAMPGSPATINGLLIAVRDCCLWRAGEAPVHQVVADELSLRINRAAPPPKAEPTQRTPVG